MEQLIKTINIFGAGISGATMARLLAESGFQVNVFERRGFVGGNCYDYKDFHGVMVHKYGPHIFHTSNEEVYSFITRFCTLNNYRNEVLVNIDDVLYPLPFNFAGIDQKYSPEVAEEIKAKLTKLFSGKVKVSILDILNSNDPQLKDFANFVYEKVFVNYTIKMWGIDIKDIDPNTINRVGVVIGYERSYFPEDKYQGLPIKGYTKLVKDMLSHPNIKLFLNSSFSTLQIKNNKTFIHNKEVNEAIFYCGTIDELFDFKYGELPFRSLSFHFETLEQDSFQQAPIVNYPSHPTMTRIAEYKKLSLKTIPGKTTISREFPGEYSSKSKDFFDRYYPINNQNAVGIFEKYITDARKIPNLHMLGRLAEYKYYDMDDAIAATIEKFKNFLEHSKK